MGATVYVTICMIYSSRVWRMSGLTRDGMVGPVSRDQTLMVEQRNGEKMISFPVQLTMTNSTIGNHTRLIPSLSVENEQAGAGRDG